MPGTRWLLQAEAARAQLEALDTMPVHTLLAWAAKEGRVLLTHDQHTVPKYAYEGIMAGLPMPGVFVGDTDLPVQQAIEDLLLVECSAEHAWESPVRYLPL